jgi:hypothetical protein
MIFQCLSFKITMNTIGKVRFMSTVGNIGFVSKIGNIGSALKVKNVCSTSKVKNVGSALKVGKVSSVSKVDFGHKQKSFKKSPLREAVRQNSIKVDHLHDEDILTKALMIAKYQHELYDRNEKLNTQRSINGKNKMHSENWYHAAVVDGILQHHKVIDGVEQHAEQTKDCLIVAACYNTPVAEIHTPFGIWTVCGGATNSIYKNKHGIVVDSDSVLQKEIFETMKCVMLCPRYETSSSCSYGPYWLVKSIHGIPVPHPTIKLLPEPENPYLDLHDVTQKRMNENKQTLKRYQQQLSTFYKSEKECIPLDESGDAFNTALKEWLAKGYISDTKGYSKLMLDDDVYYNFFANYFLQKIDRDHHEYILSGSKNDQIFKMIYYSKTNDNSFPGIKCA